MKFKIYHLLICELLFFVFPCKHSFSQEFEMPGYISDLSACDFDLNGAKDIIVTCPYADTLVILFNNGCGNFEPYYFVIGSLHAICGCVDEDSIPDFIAGVGQQYFYKSNGNRTFENGIPIMTFSGTITIYGLIDLNDDEWNDLLYTNTSDENWGIYKNNGDLTFTNEIIQSGSSTTKPGVGFITEDSLPEIVLTYSAFDRSSVNVNNGNFNFTEVVLEETFIGEAFVMNLDNQGTDDFVFVNYYTNTVPLYKYSGDNQFELQSNFYAPGAYTIASFLADDFNQDGFDDFAITRCSWTDCTDSIYIYFNNQNWSFNEPTSYYVGYLGFFNLKSADLNGDSFPDLYMSGAGTNGNKTLKILWNDGTGLFSYFNPVKIEENIIKPIQINIFPNPFFTQTTIEIKLTEPEDIDMSITDIFGKKLEDINLINSARINSYTLSWSSFEVNGNPYPPGIYILTVKSKSFQIARKVIKYSN
jgi:hypothetical protein